MSLTGRSRVGHSSGDLVCPIAPSPTEFKLYFTSLLRVLCSVRSHYLCTIGLEECLAFAVDACNIREGYPTPATLELPHTVLISITGLSPCITLCSKRLRRDGRVMRGSPDTTCPVRDSVWAVSRSLAVTNDIALRFLFLPILRCFSSRGSSLREAIAEEILIRKSKVLRLRAAPLGLSQLGTSFISSRAELSTSWHSSQRRCDSLNCTERVQWTPGSHVHTVSYSPPRWERWASRPFPTAV